MSGFKYISVFSGIGGLEHPTIEPVIFCERDILCQKLLRLRHPNVKVIGDILDLKRPPKADMVAGGWPCQDISSAGTLGGIKAVRSGLFFEMLRVARSSGSHTIVGENVPNLLTINGGHDFKVVLDALVAEGYPHVAWRILNARAFGLPQERRRLFIVASKIKKRAEALHTNIPALPIQKPTRLAYGFYWTGGSGQYVFRLDTSPP